MKNLTKPNIMINYVSQIFCLIFLECFFLTEKLKGIILREFDEKK
jgi:hypothetical protein